MSLPGRVLEFRDAGVLEVVRVIHGAHLLQFLDAGKVLVLKLQRAAEKNSCSRSMMVAGDMETKSRGR